MKKILGIIIFIAILGLGGYYVYANYIVSEKEKVAEALVNTMNLKEYTSMSVVGVELDSPSLTEEQKNLLKSVKLGVRSTVTKDVIESYLIIDANLNVDGYVKEYPLNLSIGANIDLKNEVVNIDFTQILRAWNEFATVGYTKIDPKVLEKEGMTHDELKAILDLVTAKVKETMGKEIFESESGYAISMTFQEIADEAGVEKTEIDELVKIIKQEGMTPEEQKMIELMKTQMMNVVNMITEEMFKEKSVTLTLENVANIATNILSQPDVRSEILKLTEEQGLIITEEAYTEGISGINTQVAEMKKSLKIKEMNFKADYEIDKKTKTFSKYDFTVQGSLETGESGQIKIGNTITQEVTFALPKNVKKVGMKEFEETMEALSDEFDLGNGAEEEYDTNQNIDEAFSDGVYEEGIEVDQSTVLVMEPLEFVEEEEGKDYEWQNRQQVNAEDGNVYVNYYYEYVDGVMGHTQKITKQTIQNQTDGSERVLVYYKDTGYADGVVIKQEYQLLWDEGGEYHQYKYSKGMQNGIATPESIENIVKGRYDSDGLFEEMW